MNSLGMKFVPVPITGGPTDKQRVLFCIWETRVQDYEVFADETKREWPAPAFMQGPTHPAVNLSWDDAKAFCDWLTERERRTGQLRANERYRLPGDYEWSCAVRVREREDPRKTPSEKNGKGIELPWGTVWPPPQKAGNYSGEECKGHEASGQKILTGYRDDFPETAPVGSFAANHLGLFDLGGNAWEWCEDFYNSPAEGDRVLRGASFLVPDRSGMLSSCRIGRSVSNRGPSQGFRVVLAPAQ